ncbi:ScbA/BarX family gamma-butyrolactone biosynthesis protein [Arthrobacter castelli]|uniref:ScbA/BarX family gamma-butyrolactone biosynthesis protein n=1 Tax=Arthrobacter castelli TaxID=271431 RepID=UPI0009D6FA33|nr:ScbA/BarX family gamma-butyrolactone biosynthesis protein [Arthrobacter castelli]
MDFNSTVDRRLVHRASLSEVFLTGIRRTQQNTFRCGMQWPRRHTFYRSSGLPDSLLVAETIRQVTILVAHAMFGVPLTHRFLMSGLNVSVNHGRYLDNLHQQAPRQGYIDVDVDSVEHSGPVVSSLQARATFLGEDGPFASGTGGARIVKPCVYQRMRASTTAGEHPVPGSEMQIPGSVGHVRAENVVIGPSYGAGVCPVRVDVSNPILFDHPLDHVPGMLLIESIRQAVRAELGVPELDFSTFEGSFSRVVELATPAEVRLDSLRPRSTAAVEVSARITQQGGEAAKLNGRLTPATIDHTPEKQPLPPLRQHDK